MTPGRPTPATVVIAPDSFKGSASAKRIAAALAAGWLTVRPHDRVVLMPMADGGEGTLDAFETAVPGACRYPIRVLGPAGADVDSHWLLLPDGTGVIELASASGIGLMPVLKPFDAHTVGCGQAIVAALDGGADRLLIALGGSASTDAGSGILRCLGARFLDASGEPIALGNRGLSALVQADLSGLRALPPGGVRILTDVSSPLLGPRGAAAVFGPQKGADSEEVVALEAGLHHVAEAIDPDRSRRTIPGAGAAGGAAFGLLVWGADIEAGSVAIGQTLGLPRVLESADIVITGEGRFDGQSEVGKVPGYVSDCAQAADVPVLLVAGSIAAPTSAFADAIALADLAGSPAEAMREPQRWAMAAGAALAAR